MEQAQINLREAQGAHFSYVLLAAAYAQQGRSEESVRAATAVWHMDPTFDPQAFGSKLQNPADLERLRDGLREAKLYAPPAPDQR